MNGLFTVNLKHLQHCICLYLLALQILDYYFCVRFSSLQSNKLPVWDTVNFSSLNCLCCYSLQFSLMWPWTITLLCCYAHRLLGELLWWVGRVAFILLCFTLCAFTLTLCLLSVLCLHAVLLLCGYCSKDLNVECCFFFAPSSWPSTSGIVGVPSPVSPWLLWTSTNNSVVQWSARKPDQCLGWPGCSCACVGFLQLLLLPYRLKTRMLVLNKSIDATVCDCPSLCCSPVECWFLSGCTLAGSSCCSTGFRNLNLMWNPLFLMTLRKHIFFFKGLSIIKHFCLIVMSLQ